jgi:hypothetical protein
LTAGLPASFRGGHDLPDQKRWALDHLCQRICDLCELLRAGGLRAAAWIGATRTNLVWDPCDGNLSFAQYRDSGGCQPPRRLTTGLTRFVTQLREGQ